MNSIKRSSICLPVAAMILAAGFAVPAAAEKHVSIVGAILGHENDVPQGTPPSTLSVDGLATGIATHLGRCTAIWKLTVNLADGSATGTSQFSAANGDSIFTTIAGQGDPTDTPGLNRIVEINTVTGGTGRFAGAKGTLTMERLVDLNTGATSGWFHGTIVLSSSGR